MGPTIKVEIAMCNVKKLDTKAYGIEKPDCTVVVGIEGTDLSFTTQTQRGLDPQFEETATFEVKDVTKDRLFGKFFMNKNTKQIGGHGGPVGRRAVQAADRAGHVQREEDRYQGVWRRKARLHGQGDAQRRQLYH